MKSRLILITIIILGIILRLTHLTEISLWHDEAFSALLIKYPWREMLYRIGLDVHPPLYYIALRLWHYMFSDALASLRGFSVLFGVLSIPAAYALVITAFKNRTAALWSALLVAVNPFFIYYVTEARMYTFGAFLAIMGAWSLVKALETQAEAEYNLAMRPVHRWYYLLFAILVSAMMYTHYYLFFTIAALGIYGLLSLAISYKLEARTYLWFFFAVILSAALYIPWLPTFLRQLKQVEGGYWIPSIDRWSIPSTIWQMLTGQSIDIGRTSAVAFAIIAVTIIITGIIVVLRKQHQMERVLLALLVAAPFAGALVFVILARLRGSDSSVFLVRYFVFTVPFLSITLALWMTSLKRAWLGKIILTLYAIECLFLYRSYWQQLDTTSKPGMNGASSYLNDHVKPIDALVIGSSFEFFNFKYYNHTGIAPLLYTSGTKESSNLPHFAGTAILTNKDLLPDFNTINQPNKTIWLIWTNGFGGSKPEVPNVWQQLEEKIYPEVRPYVGTNIYIAKYISN